MIDVEIWLEYPIVRCKTPRLCVEGASISLWCVRTLVTRPLPTDRLNIGGNEMKIDRVIHGEESLVVLPQTQQYHYGHEPDLVDSTHLETGELWEWMRTLIRRGFNFEAIHASRLPEHHQKILQTLYEYRQEVDT